MVEYNKVNLKLSDSQLNELKTPAKNQTTVTCFIMKLVLYDEYQNA